MNAGEVRRQLEEVPDNAEVSVEIVTLDGDFVSAPLSKVEIELQIELLDTQTLEQIRNQEARRLGVIHLVGTQKEV